MNYPRRPIVLLLFLAVASSVCFAQVSDPRITSWWTANSARYARVFETAADKSAGNAVTTWPRSGLTNGGGGVATATYSDIQRVVYSNNYVYVTTTGLPSYTMGHWLTPNGGVYTSWPKNRGAIHRIPRTPSIPTTKQKNNGSGGVLVNGVFVWANGDAQSYNTSTGVVSMQGGQGIWNRLAGVAEAFNFDPAYGHQPNNGAYHNHVNPIALRYQLGDNVTYNAATKTYSEAATLTRHSPLIGWANDGLPIYGPYGYSSAMDATSGIRRMTTGFQKRDGTNGTTNLNVTGRTTLPKWAAEVQGRSQTLAATEYGPSTTATYQVAPNVTGTYTLGMFAEDYEYLGDLGKTQGVDFDLNRQNVRYCVTPEFPGGTYAYFVAIDASGATVFPDIINQEYFGTAPMGQGTVTSINETVTEYVLAGPAAAIDVTATAASGGATLAWNSAEGATYKVETSSDNTTWTTLASAVTSAGTTTSYAASASSGYFRVTLTAIATYDANGTSGTPIGKSGTISYGVSSAMAPTLTTHPANVTVAAGASATFTVVASGTTPLAYQWQKDGNAIAGATAASYTIASAQAADVGTYRCVVSNAAGSVTSNGATPALSPTTGATAPEITTQPMAQSAVVGGSVSFAVVASGTPAPSYQWRLNGSALAGATAATLTLATVKASDAGNYSVVVANSAGSVTSATATLTVTTTGIAPSLASEPSDATANVGGSVTFTVTALGTAPLSYQWRKDGAAIAGATGAALALANVSAGDAAGYSVVVSNSLGSVTSRGARLTVNATADSSGTYFATFGDGSLGVLVRADRSAAVVGYAPGSRALVVERKASVGSDGRLRFSVLQAASAGEGRAAAATEWTIELSFGANGGLSGSVTGAGATLAVSGSKAATGGSASAYAGFYESGASGSGASAYMFVAADGRALMIAVQAGDAAVGTGTVDATGLLAGVMRSGATVAGQLSTDATLTATITASGASRTFSGGSDTRTPAERLTNLSTRGTVGPGALIVGFFVTGDAAKPILLRAVGPSLRDFGVDAALMTPRLEVFRGSTLVATGETWTAGGFANTGAIVNAAARVGAFPLASTSRDAALLLTLEPGSYSAVVSGVAGATGVALVEAYDASETPVYVRRMTNVATRAGAGLGDSALIAGFVISGEVAKRMLVRGVGPGLAAFRVDGALADPELRIQSNGTAVAANDDWSQDAATASTVAAAAAQVGAFALTAGSKDAALLVHLMPGAYTAQVMGVGGSVGTALIEIYEVP